jgi:hypothetical protein
MATYASLNSSTQSYCGRQLRTFDKTVGYYINSYVRGTPPQTSYSRGQWHYTRYEYVNASNSVYSNYLDSSLYTGQLIRSSDVQNSISSIVRRTVDLIEGRISNRTINAYYCHASCHTSCHSSRGRR